MSQFVKMIFFIWKDAWYLRDLSSTDQLVIVISIEGKGSGGHDACCYNHLHIVSLTFQKQQKVTEYHEFWNDTKLCFSMVALTLWLRQFKDECGNWPLIIKIDAWGWAVREQKETDTNILERTKFCS